MAGGEVKKSDLGVRTLSAIVMVAVAGTALWLGGRVWTAFVAAVALGVLWEWRGLVVGFEQSPVKRGLWNVGGIVYVGIAGLSLATMRMDDWGLSLTLAVVMMVICTDVGAYFSGRTFGGPKIAPKISPSKTWAGLGGGIAGASLVFFGFLMWMRSAMCAPFLLSGNCGSPDAETIMRSSFTAFGYGALVAIIAQSGDFFESWMKRRAGMKDSGKLIPGHGGLFDRVDGLLAVCFVIGLVLLVTIGGTLLSGGSLLPSPA